MRAVLVLAIKNKLIEDSLMKQSRVGIMVRIRRISTWTSRRIRSDSMVLRDGQGPGYFVLLNLTSRRRGTVFFSGSFADGGCGRLVRSCNEDTDMELNTHFRSLRGVQRIGRE